MGSPLPVSAARVPVSCVPPASGWPTPSAPLAGAPPISGQPPGSFRPHVRTPAGSARIVPLWLSCSPKPSFLLGLEARNKVHGLWFTGGARSEHRKGPIQSSELTKFRKHKGAVKMHTLLDLHGNIPTFISITDGKVHDVNILDEFLPEAGAFYVMDRGYVDFERLFEFTLSSAFFVVRTKSNVLLQRRYSHAVDNTTGVRSDHTVILTAIDSAKAYPEQLRRISYLDVETRKRFKFLTNNFTLPALTIALI